MKNGISGAVITASTYGLADFTCGMPWMAGTMRSSRLLRLMSATSRCMTVMLPVPPLPAKPVELAR